VPVNIDIVGAFTARDSDFMVVLEFISVTITVKLKVPPAEGVPEILPPEDKFKPAGSEPDIMLKLYGAVPPETVIVLLYVVATVPGVKDDADVINKGETMNVLVLLSVLTFPAASVAVADMVWGPSGKAVGCVKLHAPPELALVVPIKLPSTKMVKVALFSADPLYVGVLLVTVAPLATKTTTGAFGATSSTCHV
jgi:hypothetical protein